MINDFCCLSLLISNGSFSFISNLIINCHKFYIVSKRFFQKRKGLSDARVESITKKEYGFAVHFFVKIHKIANVNI